MTIPINPQRITGNWLSGIALDVHTVSSTYLGVNEAGHDVFDTTRSELGQLLYRLKYNGDRAAAKSIIAVASEYLSTRRVKFDLIVPVPPSTVRAVQPVILLAKGISAEIGVPISECVIATRAAVQLKNVGDATKRKELLDGLYSVKSTDPKDKNILLFDDLFRSGATMNAITDVLMEQGGAASVRAFAITRTRSNQ